jgi:hypothetical protein
MGCVWAKLCRSVEQEYDEGGQVMQEMGGPIPAQGAGAGGGATGGGPLAGHPVGRGPGMGGRASSTPQPGEEGLGDLTGWDISMVGPHNHNQTTE